MNRVFHFVIFVLVLCGIAQATPIYVTNLDPGVSGRAGILVIDPSTGVQNVFSVGVLFLEPNSIVRSSNGDFFVANEVNVLHIDGATGAQTVYSSGGLLGPAITGITLGLNGDVYASVCCNVGVPSIVRLHGPSGAQSLLAAGGLLGPFRITTAPDGRLLVADPGGLIALDPTSGSQTTISSGGLFMNLWDVTVGPDGFAYVLDATIRSVVRVDLVTGAQSLVSAKGLISPIANGLGFDETGELLVTVGDNGATGRLLGINTVTGAQRVLSTGQFLTFPYDIADPPVATGPVGVPEPESAAGLLGGLLAALALKVSKTHHLTTSYRKR